MSAENPPSAAIAEEAVAAENPCPATIAEQTLLFTIWPEHSKKLAPRVRSAIHSCSLMTISRKKRWTECSTIYKLVLVPN